MHGEVWTLTCIRRVGGGAVEEAGRSGDAQVGHSGRSVSVHGGGYGVVVGLLGCGARHVAARRHAVGVTRVTWNAETKRQVKTSGSDIWRGIFVGRMSITRRVCLSSGWDALGSVRTFERHPGVVIEALNTAVRQNWSCFYSISISRTLSVCLFVCLC